MAYENLKKAGIKYLLGLLKDWMEETFATISGTVFSVNGTAPDENGDVSIARVDMAGNLETTFKQNNTAAFMQRTTGGSSAIINGQARLISVLGNIVRDGYSAAVVDISWTATGEDDPMSATVDKDAFIGSLDDPSQSTTVTLSYTSAWSDDPADYGITVSGTPANGDQIVVDYTPEVRGTIQTANPVNFIATGWNLYDPVNEYAKVVKYSDTYGYRIAGTYTALEFATTPTGTTTPITPSNGIFQIPSDGYVIVTGGSTDDTEIYPTWSDWENGRSVTHEDYTTSSISLSDVISTYFPYGLCAVSSVRDEINLNTGRAIRRIDRMSYTDANLATAKASGRGYTYDSDYIYIVLASPVTSAISVTGTFNADDHGIEYFTDTFIPVYANTLYSMNLKNKLERDVATLSQQTISAEQKQQVRTNIGAAGAAELALKLDINAPLFFAKQYSTSSTVSVNSNAEKVLTYGNFGITPIDGYTPVAITSFSGKAGILLRRCDKLSGNADSGTTIIAVRNVTGSTISGFTPSITLLYVKSSLVTTAPEEG